MSLEPALVASASTDDGSVIVSLYDDRVMVVRFARRLVVDLVVARVTRQLQASLDAGHHVVVADLRGLAYADKEAREYFSTDPTGDQRAIAVIVGPRVSGYVAERWVNDHQLDRPVSVFMEPRKALQWARAKARELIPSDLSS